MSGIVPRSVALRAGMSAVRASARAVGTPGIHADGSAALGDTRLAARGATAKSAGVMVLSAVRAARFRPCGSAGRVWPGLAGTGPSGWRLAGPDGEGEVGGGELSSGPGAAGWPGRGLAAPDGGVQLFGGRAGGGGLRRPVLGVAEVGHGVGEGGEAGQQHERGQGWVAGGLGEGAQQPGGVPQPAPGGWSGEAAIGGAGGPVVAVRGLAQHAAAQRGSGGVQRAGGGPGRVGVGGRVGAGQRADLCRCGPGGPGGVLRRAGRRNAARSRSASPRPG